MLPARPWMVRRLTVSWAERCADVSARAIDAMWPEEEQRSIVAVRLRTPEVWEQFFVERTVFGACDQAGTLLGVATVHRAGDTAYLGALGVVRRRCGIGTALTVARLDQARRWGCMRVLALVRRATLHRQRISPHRDSPVSAAGQTEACVTPECCRQAAQI